ncbi:MAG TPA: cytochrome b/b6 domain-containing protein, partial [Casimicrobiaceae bacterium]
MNDSAHPAIPAIARARDANSAPTLVRRHAAAVRVMHWINVVAIVALFMSGLGIFNAHPALYWGESSYAGRPPWLAIGVR